MARLTVGSEMPDFLFSTPFEKGLFEVRPAGSKEKLARAMA